LGSSWRSCGGVVRTYRRVSERGAPKLKSAPASFAVADRLQSGQVFRPRFLRRAVTLPPGRRPPIGGFNVLITSTQEVRPSDFRIYAIASGACGSRDGVPWVTKAGRLTRLFIWDWWFSALQSLPLLEKCSNFDFSQSLPRLYRFNTSPGFLGLAVETLIGWLPVRQL
jgi:hypothetical protein